MFGTAAERAWYDKIACVASIPDHRIRAPDDSHLRAFELSCDLHRTCSAFVNCPPAYIVTPRILISADAFRRVLHLFFLLPLPPLSSGCPPALPDSPEPPTVPLASYADSSLSLTASLPARRVRSTQPRPSFLGRQVNRRASLTRGSLTHLFPGHRLHLVGVLNLQQIVSYLKPSFSCPKGGITEGTSHRKAVVKVPGAVPFLVRKSVHSFPDEKLIFP
jgi:hypothetical protein